MFCANKLPQQAKGKESYAGSILNENRLPGIAFFGY